MRDKALNIINKAFARLENLQNDFKKYYKIYMAEYSEDALKTLKEKNLSNLYVPLVRNITNTICGQFNNAFFGNKSPIELRASLSDDTEKIASLNRLLTYYYNQSIPQNELLKAIRNAFVYGFGCIHIYWDKQRDLPITKCMSIDSIALDYHALNFRDNKYVARKEKVSEKTLQETFKGKYDFSEGEDRLLTYKELYIKQDKMYNVYCFIEDTFVHEYKIDILPFCFGYAYDRLLPSNIYNADKVLAYIGDCLPRILAPMQEEMNKKRNQKIELDDLAMNPKVVYQGDFPIDIFQSGAGSAREVADLDSFKVISQGGQINIERDINLIDKEANEASGITSIDMGRTSVSDRRSGTSLSFLAQSSSVRLEEAIATLNNTLFNNWAKSFVRLVNLYAHPNIRKDLQAEEIFENIQTRLKINFGSSIAVNQKIQNLMQIQQMLSQNPNVNPEFLNNISKEIVLLMGGDEYEAKHIFGDNDAEQQRVLEQGLM